MYEGARAISGEARRGDMASGNGTREKDSEEVVPGAKTVNDDAKKMI